MRIVSGDTARKLGFVAVDSTDLETRETGLTSFTVYRSRDGGTAAAMTTPTVAEVDATNMPGFYVLTLDEDMTITSSVDSEEMAFHITQASMAPVTRTIELYRRTVTAGNTLDVTAAGTGGIDWGNVENKTTANDLSGTDIQLCDTTTTNTDMRGTDSALLATSAPTNFGDMAITVTTGQVDANTIQISGDTIAADNLESMYDGTGYTDDTAPASRSQVDGIGAASGAALNFQNEADNVDSAIKSITFDGVETSGTNVSANFDDGVYHNITHIANNIDIVYQFDVGGGRTAAEVVWKGYLNSNNDVFTLQVYNGTGWDTLTTHGGKNGATNDTVIESLFLTHTGTGADLGKVFIRLECASQSSPDLFTDQLLVTAVNIGQSVGYSNGRIFIDTTNGVAGTEAFVNGVADNPVDLIASAKTLSTSVGLSDFHIINGSSVTLAETTDNESYFGDNWILALGGQSCSGSHFEGAHVSGIQTGDNCGFHGGAVTTITISDHAHFDEVSLESGTITLPVGAVFFNYCTHAGASLPVFDFGAVVGSTTLHIHAYAGGIELQNFGDLGTDIVHLDGNGRLDINANSSGGTVNVRGNWDIRNSASGVTINRHTGQSAGYSNGAIYIDTNASNTNTIDFADGVAENPVSSIAAAKTLSASTTINDFHILNGSSITLAESTANESYFGDHWTLALGGQACGGLYCQGATVSGIGTSSGEEMHFEGCDVGTTSVQQGHFDKCGFNGTLTMTSADDYDFHNCYSKGDIAPIFTKTAGQAIVAEFQNYAGDITVSGLQSGDTVELGGFFRTIILNGADATVHVHGHYEALTNNLTGAPTVEVTGAIKTNDIASILVDTGTTIPATLAGLNDIAATDIVSSGAITTSGGAVSNVTLTATTTNVTNGVDISTTAVDDIWDEVLTGATHNVNQSSGKRLRAISGSIFSEGTAQSGGANSIQLTSGAVTSDDQFRRSKVIIVLGTGLGQEAIITSSVAITDTLTVTPAWLTNPDATSEYEIIPGQVHSTTQNGGYDDAAVWLNANSGAAGDELYVNGTSTNPSSVIADARTVADSLMLRRFRFLTPGTFTLDQSYIDWQFSEEGATLALNSQVITGSTFARLGITGIGTSTSGFNVYNECGIFGPATLPRCNSLNTAYAGTITLSQRETYVINKGILFSESSPFILDFAGDGITATNVIFSGWHGKVEIRNMTSTDTLRVYGIGEVILHSTCVGGVVELSGNMELTNNGSGQTITQEGLVNKSNINIECDTAISDAALATAASITALNDITVSEILTTQMTESYAANGIAPTLSQALYACQQILGQFAIIGTSNTIRKLDNSTTAFVMTLDDASNPTSLGRSSDLVTVPEAATAYYAFQQSTASLAVLELVNEQTSLMVEHDHQKNFFKADGSIDVAEMGEAALTGDGVLAEAVSITNKCTNYNFKPTDFTNVTQSGSAVFTVADGFSDHLTGIASSNGNAYIIDNTLEASSSSLIFTGDAGNTNIHSLSAIIFVASGFAKLKRSTTTTDEITIAANSSFELTKLDGFTAASLDKVEIEATAGSLVAVISNQLEENANTSSRIEVEGSSATRDSDIATASTFLEESFWRDSPTDNGGANFCITANRTAAGWLNGVNTAGTKVSFYGAGNPDTKYAFLLPMVATGLIATGSNGVKFRGTVAADAAADIDIVTVIVNSTGLSDVDAIRQGFGNDGTDSNPWTLDFTTSDLLTGSLAADSLVVKTLRNNAGDDLTWLNAQPAAAQWPVTDFKLSGSFEYRGDDGSAEPRIYDGNNGDYLYWDRSAQEIRHSANVTLAVALAAFTYGQTYTYSLEVTGTGSTLIFDAVSSGFIVAVTSVQARGATIQLNGRTAGDRQMNSVHHTLLLE